MPDSRAARTPSLTATAPLRCPSIRGSPRRWAQRPLPSMITATWRGNVLGWPLRDVGSPELRDPRADPEAGRPSGGSKGMGGASGYHRREFAASSPENRPPGTGIRHVPLPLARLPFPVGGGSFRRSPPIWFVPPPSIGSAPRGGTE